MGIWLLHKLLYRNLGSRALWPMSLCRARGICRQSVGASRLISLSVFRCYRRSSVFPCTDRNKFVGVGSAFQFLQNIFRSSCALSGLSEQEKLGSCGSVLRSYFWNTSTHSCTLWSSICCPFGRVEKDFCNVRSSSGQDAGVFLALSRFSSSARLMTSAMEIPRRLASDLSHASCGLVRTIDRWMIAMRVSYTLARAGVN